jgi:hypothetical protein
MQKTISQLFVLICFLAVQGFSQLTSVSLQSPASGGSGTVQRFSVTVAGGAGGYGTDWTQFIVSNTVNNTYGIPNSCSVLFYPNGQMYIGNDAQTQWTQPTYFGSSSSITNSQCSVAMTDANMTTFGSSRTWSFTITFASSFGGAKYLSGGTSITSGAYTNPPTQLGAWTVPTSGCGIPSVSLASPASGGSGTTQRFSISAAGCDQGWTSLQITSGGTGWSGWSQPNSCDFLFYPDGTVYIGNDGQTAWTQQGALGSGGTIANTQCSADRGGGTNSYFGNTRTYSITITFNPSFLGSKNILGMSSTSGGAYNSPMTLGNWNIPAGVDTNMVITRDFAVPPDPGTPIMSKVVIAQSGEAPDTLKVYHVNDPIQIQIRFAKPNTQVWALRLALDLPSGVFYPHTDMCSTTPMTPDGGCFLGTTDGNGTLVYNTTAYPLVVGLVTTQFYLGNYDANTPLNEANYIGAIAHWVVGLNGLPTPPAW